MAELITGIFHDRIGAENAVDRLETLGYQREEISVLMHDQTRAKDFADMTGTAAAANKSSAGAKIGASVGGALAAIVAGIAAKRSDGEDRTASSTTSGTPLDASQSGTTYGDVTAPASPRGTASAPATYGTYDTSSNRDSSRPFVAGPLGATLAGAGLGGLIGALAGAGVDKKLAERYERDLAAGGIVIGVTARPESEARVRDMLLGHDGGPTSVSGRV